MLVLGGEAGGKMVVTAMVLACSKHGKLPGKKASLWGQYQAHFMQLGTHSQEVF